MIQQAQKAPPHRCSGRGHDTERLVSMREAPYSIPLRRHDGTIRAYALIDAEDAAIPLHGSTVGALRWSLANGYAHRRVPTLFRGEGPRCAKLHRVILGLSPGDGLQVDHISRDGLDCRRSNLRIVTNAQNGQNRGPSANGTSGVRGVCWNVRRGKWHAYAMLGGCNRYLGLFATLAEAEAVVVAFRRKHMPFSEIDQVSR